ncbi:histidine kinase [Fictibacillus phosphorivorans]|uniref:Histidine kinase n=1 Tax=Fictibacillus phosphorivorans TaxID=1221500 RepID=A0A160IRG0_9BACL|nr:histidine kinase [Fictibacillus phosphorivorans]ANC78532.1 histidine kinase [Fictibacillus phosphorivorans]
MNDKQKLLFDNLKNLKDYWVKTSVDSLNPNTDLIWSDNENEYKILQSKIKTQEELVAFAKIQDELIKGVIHSILVMIDGGDELADNYLLDLVDRKTKESLLHDIALHEEFYNYLVDCEEE